MENEKLMEISGDYAKDPVSIVYKRNQTDNLDFTMEINGNTVSLFASICEIVMIWALGFNPEDREDQVKYLADVCIAGLKNEEYIAELKQYLEMN